MNEQESRDFLKGRMAFTPVRMMRYIRSRARLSTNEDIEDILQNALILVTRHFQTDHQDANLSLYCLSACNKAIAQNLERYHKITIKKHSDILPDNFELLNESETMLDGQSMKVKTLSAGSTYKEQSVTANQWRVTSLDTLFDVDDGRSADDVIGGEHSLLAAGSQSVDPLERLQLKDLIAQIIKELPTQLHRTCFILKYVQGFKREDLITCLKMDAKSIDTIDKKIVRTLKSFKEKLEGGQPYAES